MSVPAMILAAAAAANAPLDAPRAELAGCAALIDRSPPADAHPIDVEVQRGEHSVDLRTHDPRLDPPRTVAIDGLDLLYRHDVESEGDEVRAAVIEIEPKLASACAPGRYELYVGDQIGEDIQVVAILREGLLVEHGERLAFAPFAGRTAPPFRMIWSSDFELIFPPDPVKASPAKKKPKKRSRRKR